MTQRIALLIHFSYQSHKQLPQVPVHSIYFKRSDKMMHTIPKC